MRLVPSHSRTVGQRVAPSDSMGHGAALAVIAAIVTAAERHLEKVDEGAEISRPVRGRLVKQAEKLLAFRGDVPEIFKGF